MAWRHHCHGTVVSLFFVWATTSRPLCIGLHLTSALNTPSSAPQGSRAGGRRTASSKVISLLRKRSDHNELLSVAETSSEVQLRKSVVDNTNCVIDRSTWHGPNLSAPDLEAPLRSWASLPVPGGFSSLLAAPKPAILMMSFSAIVFGEAWEQFFSQADHGTFSLLVHLKERTAVKQIPEFFRPYIMLEDVPTDRCHDTQLMIRMMSLALEDENVTHVAFVSGDALPLKPLSYIIEDLAQDGRSRFCADTQWHRAETWIVLERKHALLFSEHWDVLKQLIPYSDCEDEDLFYWPLEVRQENLNDHCPMLTDWSGTMKFWREKTEKCGCPSFLASDKVPAKCSKPALFLDVSSTGLSEVIGSSAGYWYARKFAGDGTDGITTYEGNASLDVEMARRLKEQEKLRQKLAAWRDSKTVRLE